jgi:hypothetical protein
MVWCLLGFNTRRLSRAMKANSYSSAWTKSESGLMTKKQIARRPPSQLICARGRRASVYHAMNETFAAAAQPDASAPAVEPPTRSVENNTVIMRSSRGLIRSRPRRQPDDSSLS